MAKGAPPPSASTTWLIVAAAAAVLLVVGAVVVSGGEQGPKPPFLEHGVRPPQPSAVDLDPNAPLGLAGSGSNLPITRSLVASFTPDTGRLPVVHPSIGSGGGVRALLDGVVDVALVSRPLKERERALGLVAVPYARVPVIVAVHADVPDQDITTPQLVAVFAGHQGTWSDGSRITVLQRERGDSSHRAVASAIAGFAETNDEAYREGRWRVLYHDDAMTDALDSTPGALGLFGQGKVPATRSLRALTVDGVPPTVAAIRGQRYPFTKDLALVMMGEPRGAVAEFVRFVQSSAGRTVIEAAGAMALPTTGAASVPHPQENP